MQKSAFRTTAFRSCIGASMMCLGVSGAMAQTTAVAIQSYPSVQVTDVPLEYRQFDRVEVTGSSIVNPKSKDALPVRVIDAKEIERTGIRSTAQLIQSLPMMNTVNELGGVNTAGLGGYQSGAIHGYEAGTLVLINGRRSPSFARQRADQDRTAVDISMVPLRAIERIEILTDGASALYGSDAIAGVINIITKQQAPGLSLSAEGVSSQGAGGDGQKLGMSWGSGKLKQDGYAVQLHLEMSDRSGVLLRDRAYSDHVTQFYGNDVNGAPVYFKPLNTFENALPGKIQKAKETAADCPAGFEYAISANPLVNKCQNSQLRGTNLYPENHSKNVHGQFEYALNHDHSVFGELGYVTQTNEYSRQVNGRTSVNISGGRTVLFDGEVLSPGIRLEEQSSRRVVLGLRGEWNEWSYTLTMLHGKNEFSQTDKGGLTTNLWGKLFTEAELLQSPENYSQATWDKVKTVVSPDRYLRRFSTQLDDLNLTASRTVGETDWGDIKIGSVLFMQRQQSGTVAVSNPTLEPTYNAQRGLSGAALEAQVPAYEKLLLLGSLRADRYSDFGSAYTGKAGFKYDLSEQTFIRGSMGTGFRAPTLAQLDPASTRTVVSAGAYEVYTRGNADLQPEKSKQFSLGVYSQPTAQWIVGADVWQLNVKDVFGAWSLDQINMDPVLKAKYFTDNATGLDRYDISPLNLGTLQKRGIDYQVRYRIPMDKGRLWLGLEGTRHLKSDQSPYPGQEPSSDLSVYRSSTNTMTPKNRLQFSTTWDASAYQIGMRVNYMSGNLEQIPTNALVDSTGKRVGDQYVHEVPAYWTLDMTGHYEMASQTKLRFGIQNLTNKTPPLRYASLYSGGASQLTDTRYNDYYGRTIRLVLEHKFY
jgi:iron complex outermembrane receptor protein